MTEKKCIIWDIDGTIADTAWRLPYIKTPGVKKDWKSFFAESINDNPIPQTQFIYHALLDRDDVTVIVLTARGESDKDLTVQWLAKNGFHYDAIYMRGRSDHRPDHEVKFELIDLIEANHGKVFMAFEDRPGVIKNVYHAKGIWVFDVGQGVAE